MDNCFAKTFLAEYSDCNPLILNDKENFELLLMNFFRNSHKIIHNSNFISYSKGLLGTIYTENKIITITSYIENRSVLVDILSFDPDLNLIKFFNQIKAVIKSKYFLTMEIKRLPNLNKTI